VICRRTASCASGNACSNWAIRAFQPLAAGRQFRRQRCFFLFKPLAVSIGFRKLRLKLPAYFLEGFTAKRFLRSAGQHFRARFDLKAQ